MKYLRKGSKLEKALALVLSVCMLAGMLNFGTLMSSAAENSAGGGSSSVETSPETSEDESLSPEATQVAEGSPQAGPSSPPDDAEQPQDDGEVETDPLPQETPSIEEEPTLAPSDSGEVSGAETTTAPEESEESGPESQDAENPSDETDQPQETPSIEEPTPSESGEVSDAEKEETEDPEVPEEPDESPVPDETVEDKVFSASIEGDVTVRATVPAEANLPDDAGLFVDRLEGSAYDEAVADLREGLGLAAGDKLYFVPYDVYFMSDETRVEPEAGSVSVSMSFEKDPFAGLDPASISGTPGEQPSAEGDGAEKSAERYAVHILENGEVEKQTSLSETEYTFAVGSFSVMGPAMVVRAAATGSERKQLLDILEGDENNKVHVSMTLTYQSEEGGDSTTYNFKEEHGVLTLVDDKGEEFKIPQGDLGLYEVTVSLSGMKCKDPPELKQGVIYEYPLPDALKKITDQESESEPEKVEPQLNNPESWNPLDSNGGSTSAKAYLEEAGEDEERKFNLLIYFEKVPEDEFDIELAYQFNAKIDPDEVGEDNKLQFPFGGGNTFQVDVEPTPEPTYVKKTVEWLDENGKETGDSEATDQVGGNNEFGWYKLKYTVTITNPNSGGALSGTITETLSPGQKILIDKTDAQMKSWGFGVSVGDNHLEGIRAAEERKETFSTTSDGSVTMTASTADGSYEIGTSVVTNDKLTVEIDNVKCETLSYSYITTVYYDYTNEEAILGENASSGGQTRSYSSTSSTEDLTPENLKALFADGKVKATARKFVANPGAGRPSVEPLPTPAPSPTPTPSNAPAPVKYTVTVPDVASNGEDWVKLSLNSWEDGEDGYRGLYSLRYSGTSSRKPNELNDIRINGKVPVKKSSEDENNGIDVVTYITSYEPLIAIEIVEALRGQGYMGTADGPAMPEPPYTSGSGKTIPEFLSSMVKSGYMDLYYIDDIGSVGYGKLSEGDLILMISPKEIEAAKEISNKENSAVRNPGLTLPLQRAKDEPTAVPDGEGNPGGEQELKDGHLDGDQKPFEIYLFGLHGGSFKLEYDLYRYLISSGHSIGSQYVNSRYDGPDWTYPLTDYSSNDETVMTEITNGVGSIKSGTSYKVKYDESLINNVSSFVQEDGSVRWDVELNNNPLRNFLDAQHHALSEDLGKLDANNYGGFSYQMRLFAKLPYLEVQATERKYSWDGEDLGQAHGGSEVWDGDPWLNSQSSSYNSFARIEGAILNYPLNDTQTANNATWIPLSDSPRQGMPANNPQNYGNDYALGVGFSATTSLPSDGLYPTTDQNSYSTQMPYAANRLHFKEYKKAETTPAPEAEGDMILPEDKIGNLLLTQYLISGSAFNINSDYPETTKISFLTVPKEGANITNVANSDTPAQFEYQFYDINLRRPMADNMFAASVVLPKLEKEMNANPGEDGKEIITSTLTGDVTNFRGVFSVHDDMSESYAYTGDEEEDKENHKYESDVSPASYIQLKNVVIDIDGHQGTIANIQSNSDNTSIEIDDKTINVKLSNYSGNMKDGFDLKIYPLDGFKEVTVTYGSEFNYDGYEEAYKTASKEPELSGLVNVELKNRAKLNYGKMTNETTEDNDYNVSASTDSFHFAASPYAMLKLAEGEENTTGSHTYTGKYSHSYYGETDVGGRTTEAYVALQINDVYNYDIDDVNEGKYKDKKSITLEDILAAIQVKNLKIYANTRPNGEDERKLIYENDTTVPECGYTVAYVTKGDVSSVLDGAVYPNDGNFDEKMEEITGNKFLFKITRSDGSYLDPNTYFIFEFELALPESQGEAGSDKNFRDSREYLGEHLYVNTQLSIFYKFVTADDANDEDSAQLDPIKVTPHTDVMAGASVTNVEFLEPDDIRKDLDKPADGSVIDRWRVYGYIGTEGKDWFFQTDLPDYLMTFAMVNGEPVKDEEKARKLCELMFKYLTVDIEEEEVRFENPYPEPPTAPSEITPNTIPKLEKGEVTENSVKFYNEKNSSEYLTFSFNKNGVVSSEGVEDRLEMLEDEEGSLNLEELKTYYWFGKNIIEIEDSHLPLNSYISFTYSLKLDWEKIYKEAINQRLIKKGDDLKFGDKFPYLNFGGSESSRPHPGDFDKPANILGELNKKRVSAVWGDNHEITWQIDFSVAGDTINGYKLEDTFKPGKFSDGSYTATDNDKKAAKNTKIKSLAIYNADDVGENGITTGEPLFTYDGPFTNGTKVNLTGVSAITGGVLTFTRTDEGPGFTLETESLGECNLTILYTTSMSEDEFAADGGNLDNGYNVSNSVTAHVDYYDSLTEGGDASYNPPTDTPNKTVSGSGSERKWTLTVPLKGNPKEVKIIDTGVTATPAALGKYVSISEMVVKLRDKNNVEITIYDSANDLDNLIEYKGRFEGLEFGKNGSTGFTLHFDKLDKGTTVILEYTTVLDVKAAAKDEEVTGGVADGYKLSNGASIEQKWHTYPGIPPTETTVDIPKAMGKEGSAPYQKEDGETYIKWTMDVHLDSLVSPDELKQIQESGGFATVVDYLPSGLDREGVLVAGKKLTWGDTNWNEGEDLSADQIEIESVDDANNDADKQKLSVKLKNPWANAHVRLTFETKVTSNLGTVYNAAFVSIGGESETDYSEPVEGVFTSTAGGSVQSMTTVNTEFIASKTINGNSPPTGSKFSFTIQQVMPKDGKLEPVDPDDEGYVAFWKDEKNEGTNTITVQNDGNGEVSFPETNALIKENGTYFFRISENPDPELEKKYVFDKRAFIIQVQWVKQPGKHTYEVVQHLIDVENGSADILKAAETPDLGIIFENKYVGNLSISKTVEGSAGDRYRLWGFNIHVDGAKGSYPAELCYKESGEQILDTFVTFDESGNCTYYIAHDQKLTIRDLPADTVYTVAEQEANGNGYVTQSVNGSGSIKPNETVSANFTNKRNGFYVMAEKKVSFEGDGFTEEQKQNILNQEFEFKLSIHAKNNKQLVDSVEVGYVKSKKRDGGKAPEATGNGKLNFQREGGDPTTLTATFTLKDKETIEIGDIGRLNTEIRDESPYEITLTETDAHDASVNISPSVLEYDEQNPEQKILQFEAENVFKYSGFTVSKAVVGENGDRTKDWHFRVKLGDRSINGTYGDMEFTDGVTEFTLRDGESRTADGLPVGTKYTVTETEANEDGYATAVSGSEGLIEDGVNKEAKFINAKDALVVFKWVTGAGNRSRQWHFRVTLSDKTVNGTYGDMQFTDGVAEFTLKHGEFKYATGIPVGTHFTVEELDANKYGYETSAAGEKGKITEKKKAAISVFTNDLPSGNLSVTKIVKGSAGDRTKDWHFRVELSDKSINGFYGVMFFKDGVTEFTLKDGETATAVGLPAGITYTVTEAEANQDGYTTTPAEGYVQGTISPGETAKVEFVNDMPYFPPYLPPFTQMSSPTPTPTSTPAPEPTLTPVPPVTSPPISTEPSVSPSPPTEIPQTGDGSDAGFWALMAGVSLIGILSAGTGYFVSRRKRLRR